MDCLRKCENGLVSASIYQSKHFLCRCESIENKNYLVRKKNKKEKDL